jgi:chaperonin GroES
MATKTTKKSQQVSHHEKKAVRVGKAHIAPLGDRVLVRPIEDVRDQTASGIFLPDTIKKEKPETGEVVAMGEGRYEDGKRIPMHISVGDKVLFSKYGYDEVTVDGQEYYILKYDSILAVIS